MQPGWDMLPEGRWHYATQQCTPRQLESGRPGSSSEAAAREDGSTYCSMAQRTAGCSVRTKQFAQDLTQDPAAAIRAALAPDEWDVVRWCEGAHVPFEPWEEQQYRDTVGNGKKATRIQKL